MNNIIIGTAGHIDHGKTTLIKALTGVDTDRLKEEKKRGISIDLGFTSFKINPNKTAGIIDVPGHEKFLKNMLAGVAGMDIILLVVSAEEGVMPQTKEHLDILNLIGIKKGIIVLTKADKVDDEFLEMVKEDLRAHVKSSFLEDAEIIPVDSISKRGIDLLISKIDKLTEEFEPKNLNVAPRLFVDRIFSIKGFGSVVTGTLIEGILRVDDLVYLYPKKIESRVRGLQVHSQKTDIAYAGQRVAVNLSNISLDDVQRGDILSSNPNLSVSMMLDAKLTMLNDISKDLEHWDRVRVYHGAREILARVVPLEADILAKGKSGYVQLRLEEEVSCKEKDHIILRFYSPLETIGGGIILDSDPEKHTINTLNIVEKLSLKEKGTLSDRILQLIQSKTVLVNKEILIKELGDEASKIANEIDLMLENEELIEVAGLLIDTKGLDNIVGQIQKQLKYYHSKFPFRAGASKEELRTKITFKLKPKEFDALMNFLESKSIVSMNDQYVSSYGFEVCFDDKALALKNEIESYYINNKTPLQTDKIIGNSLESLEMIHYLIGRSLVKLSDDLFYDKLLIEEYQSIVKKYLDKNGEVSIKDLKDETELSRKYLIAIMEYFDRIKFTKRSGEVRISYDRN